MNNKIDELNKKVDELNKKMDKIIELLSESKEKEYRETSSEGCHPNEYEIHGDYGL